MLYATEGLKMRFHYYHSFMNLIQLSNISNFNFKLLEAATYGKCDKHESLIMSNLNQIKLNRITMCEDVWKKITKNLNFINQNLTYATDSEFLSLIIN